MFCLFICMFLKLFFLYPKEVERGKRSVEKRMERKEKLRREERREGKGKGGEGRGRERRGRRGEESRKGGGKEDRRGHKHNYLAASPGEINLLGAAIARLSAVRCLCFMLQLASL